MKSIETSELDIDEDSVLGSLREVESHLRTLGCSRTRAKAIAPELWDALRDAGTEETVVEPEVEAVKSDERERLLAQVEIMESL